jgi:hypothetical protein
MSDKKYIKALEVTDFDHQLYPGDNIKIYGEETTITGFSFQYNDGLEKWETIIHTVGRGDPLERTLPDIEVLEEQTRSYEQRTAQLFRPQPGAVWVKATTRLPGWDIIVEWRFAGKEPTARETVRFLSSAANLHQWEWLDESGQSKEGNKEREIALVEWYRLNTIQDGAPKLYYVPTGERMTIEQLWNEWNNQQNRNNVG